MWAGVAVTGAGAALLATGVALAITNRDLDSDSRAPVLSIHPGGFTLSGRF